MLVESSDLAEVEARLKSVKQRENLGAEVKWQKVTDQYLGKYKSFVGESFQLMRERKLKTRIMFSKNSDVPPAGPPNNDRDTYSKLYYQFIKHSFGLQYAGRSDCPTRIRLYLDELPDAFERNEKLKDFVVGINEENILAATNVRFDRQQIAEVKSHDHVVLQALDVILGSVPFRLNDKHLEKPEGAVRRGRRTKAKADLQQFIRLECCTLRSHFNIGESTGRDTPDANWIDSYRHWRFRPRDSSVDPTKFKP